MLSGILGKSAGFQMRWPDERHSRILELKTQPQGAPWEFASEGSTQLSHMTERGHP